MKVLFVDSSVQHGGGQLSLLRYLAHPDALSSSVVFLTPQPLTGWSLPDHVQVFNTETEVGLRRLVPLVRELQKLVDHIEPDVIVANSYSASQYVALLNKRRRKLVYYLRQEACPPGLPAAKRFLNEHLLLARFDGFLANSDWTANTLPIRMRSQRKVRVAYPVSGVTQATAGHEQVSESLRILSLSRLSPWKGIHTVIEAVRDIEQSPAAGQVKLTVAGGDLFNESSYGDRLRSLAAPLGDAVEFIGHQSDVGPLLASHDLMCCLSASPEPFGQVIVQGLAAGLVVVASDAGGPREMIADGKNGFLVPPDDPAALVGVIRQVLDDPAQMGRIGDLAAKSAERFTDSVTVAGLNDTLVELTSATS